MQESRRGEMRVRYRSSARDESCHSDTVHGIENVRAVSVVSNR